MDTLDHPARVLIVDDDHNNRSLLEAMLAPEGFVIELAESGEQALAMIALETPDLILLDVMMPGMDGYQVATAIKGDPATNNIPIIMITAHDDREARMHALNAGAAEFLSKPVDHAELRVRVKNLLRLKAYGDYRDKYAQTLEHEVIARTSEVRHERDRAKEYIDAAEVILLALDTHGNVTLLNRCGASIVGRAPAELVGYNWIESFVPAQVRDEAEKMFRGWLSGDISVVECAILTHSGEERIIEWRARLLRGDAEDVVGVLCCGTDVTDRQRLEGQFRQAQKMEAIGLLASGVAHDFNNLLTVIRGFAELMASDVQMASAHREDLAQIMNAAERATGLTAQLLAFSRKQIFHVVSLDLRKLVTEMAGMFERLIGDNIDVSLQLGPDLPPVLGDRGQLEQVIMNLVINARDAMPQGGSLRIETDVVTLQNDLFHEETVVDGPYVVLSVSDTGAGMTKETQRRLFEPFFTTKELGKGTGLGLSTVYGIVKQSKGYIWVDSELGRGTVFKVYLPISDNDLAQEDAEALVAGNVESVSETILLVEDEIGVRRLTGRVLRNAGYRVMEAENGAAAEILFESDGSSIDLLLTDVMMPGYDGAELVARLQIRAPELKVLYMSGYTEQSAADAAGISRNQHFLQKPFSAATLLRQVRQTLYREKPSRIG